ncbi:MAG: carbohydrate binding domain-containing protein [Clostridia bacterium]|nr:carbohydrate binding domain-containing protein [Clostridia bacterium]
MKKVILVILSLLLVLTLFAACKTVKTDVDAELITNGSFDDSLSAWTALAAEDETAATVEHPNEGSVNYKAAGESFVSVTSKAFNSYTQTVSLEKNCTYLLTAKVKIPSALSVSDELGGAYIAIDSDYTIVHDIATKAGDWKELKCYFNSASANEVVVRFGVGTAKYNAEGTAYFDGISLQKVDGVIDTVVPDLASASKESLRFNADYLTNTSGIVFVTLTTVLGALALYAAYAALRRMMSKKGAMLSNDLDNGANVNFFKSAAFMLILCELLAFAVRLITISFIQGGSTLGTYVNEATQLADVGAKTFYFEKGSTTPIGSLYLLWIFGLLAKPLNLVSSSMGFAIFVKIPAVLADLVAVFVIYLLANRKYNQYISALFAGVYALIPVFFFASAGWGTYAPLGALFILLSLVSLLDKKYIAAIIYFSVALLFMTEAMLLLPLLLVYIFFVFFTKGDEYKMGISVTLTSSVIALYLIALPFTLGFFAEGKPFAALTKYISAFLAHTGFTENAFTMYGLFGLGAKAANTASYVFNGIFVAVAIGFTIYLFFKSRSRLDLLLLSAFTFALTFVMTSAVDTLLIYPALLLLLVYGMISGDRRALKLFGGFSVTTLLNMSYTMMIGGYFGSGLNSDLIYMTAADPVLIIFSVANVALLGYFAYVLYSICVKDQTKGVVIIEENYFKYFAAQVKSVAVKVATFCKEKVATLFKKKEENADAGENK